MFVFIFSIPQKGQFVKILSVIVRYNRIFLCKNFLKTHMCFWQNRKSIVLLKRKLNSTKIYRYVYDLIVKTDQASHNGIFVFAFASLQIKIVCGIQNKLYRRRRNSNGKQAHGKISAWDSRLRMLVSKSKTIIHAAHRITPGWSVFSADSCIWKLGERQQTVCGGREKLRIALTAVLSP